MEDAMAFQPAPNMAEAVVKGTLNGRPNLMVLGFVHIGGAYNQADIDNLAALVDTWMATELLPLLVASFAYIETEVKGLTSATDLYAVDSTNAGNGSIVGSPLPNSVTIAIKHTSGFTGRSARGRTYVPGLAFAALDTNEDFFTTTAANNLVTAFDALIAGGALFNWAFCTISRQTAGAPRPAAVAYITTANGYTDLRVDSQRRRLG